VLPSGMEKWGQWFFGKRGLDERLDPNRKGKRGVKSEPIYGYIL